MKLWPFGKPKKTASPRKRRKTRTEEWEHIGHIVINAGDVDRDLNRVPSWLIREWDSGRDANRPPNYRTLGEKWKVREGVDDLYAVDWADWGTGYFRTGKRFRYMIVAWEGGQGTFGEGFYRKLRRSKSKTPSKPKARTT